MSECNFNPSPDFYLWGFLKDNVYRNNPQTISELKKAITQKINAIPKEECITVINNFDALPKLYDVYIYIYI